MCGSISPFSFMSLPIQFPVRNVKSGKLWWTDPLPKHSKAQLNEAHFLDWITSWLGEKKIVYWLDGYHFSRKDGRVQLLHTDDIPNPLEFFRVNKKDWFLHFREDLLIQRKHPGVQCHTTPRKQHWCQDDYFLQTTWCYQYATVISLPVSFLTS